MNHTPLCHPSPTSLTPPTSLSSHGIAPAFLVGVPNSHVTDAAPIRDYDTGYSPKWRTNPPTSGAWNPGDDPQERLFINIGTVHTELGDTIPNAVLAYETWGTLNADHSNAILLCHALTGDSHATSQHGSDGWWAEVVGPGRAIDTNTWFVVCPNVLGGCQGSTGPASIAPDGKPWGARFPQLTIRDMCAAEYRLAQHLGITRWALVAGASFGGNRTIEWAASYPDAVGAIAVLAASSACTAEQIAWQQIQITAIENDPAFRAGAYYDLPDGHGPHRGLGLAREIAHLTYRCAPELATRFSHTPQSGEDPLRGGRFAVESYLDYHAEKLVRRFDANSYICLSRALITHDIGRGRGGTSAVLATLTMPALVVAVDSDRLFYPDDVIALGAALPECDHVPMLHSTHGHDGFLIENDQVSAIFKDFFTSERFQATLSPTAAR
ncbi:MAG: homoserine O-acetyltransferase [Arcanobacterium sp.]|nr:homoserine O-acetyltransferase [Arcanobacterium sp.]MDY5589578.1 homoserine O-acetyltransferase [Arcanobacterium sp.]